jgi:hypothetical protein
MMFQKLKDYLYGVMDKRRIASNANELLQNDAFAVAVDTVQENLLNKLVSTKPTDTDMRERLYFQYRAVDDVLIELTRLYNNAHQPLPTEKMEVESHQGDKHGRRK